MLGKESKINFIDKIFIEKYFYTYIKLNSNICHIKLCTMYISIYFYAGCLTLNELAVNDRFPTLFGNENLNIKMLRKM